MAKKSGLGRGLGALLTDESNDVESLNSSLIPIEKIFPRADQPRKNFDENSLNELAKSIKEHGVIQPLLVTEKDKGYQIVAGERRYRAAKIADIKEIPVVIKDLSDQTIKEISIIENIQREDLNPIEEAYAYKSLIDDYGLTQESVAEKIGKSRSYIANTLRLLNLDDNTKEYLISGQLTPSQGRTLLSIKDIKERSKALKDFLNKKINIRDVEKNKRRKDNPEINIFIQDLESRLTESLEAKVNLKTKRKGGQIIINYFDDDDLDRIINILEED